MSPRPREGDSPVGPRPPTPGRLRAVFLAIVVHAAFFGVIIFGVSWQSQPARPLQAELWKELPTVAKAPAKADPEPEPAKPEPPRPEPPKPEPQKPEPPKPVAKPDPPRPDPAIAEKLEREKREKEKRERLDHEKKLKAEREKQEKLERQKQDDVKKKREDEKRRAEAERAKAEQQKMQDAAAAQRKTEFDSYVDKIRLRIRSKANVPDTVRGNPRVEMRIKILPGGDVLEVTVVRSSGNPAYDAAIERAIRSAQPLPVPAANSELFPRFRDLILNIEHDR